ncbi:unnamed protein product [Commensalibacter communis]|uniref:hypothetical protein n=1 Tax=Commensalibacter communis TaxID=2972786 RepID=UPI0022FF93E8|nr:hypothetical protein [Commensalibacter communis]CAI3959716.1 unnamed protein product [Commensalibacter communis]CAI3960561.1 unnamed protein product [Commensalibacter communis]CAI3961531.1 unnamed protein product [Commensalibacter communis]
MFINFKRLEQAPEQLQIGDIGFIIERQYSATREFIRNSKIKAARKGRNKFIKKSDLLAYFERNNWLPSGFLQEQ